MATDQGASLNLDAKVLDFVQLGGPSRLDRAVVASPLAAPRRVERVRNQFAVQHVMVHLHVPNCELFAGMSECKQPADHPWLKLTNLWPDRTGRSKHSLVVSLQVVPLNVKFLRWSTLDGSFDS